MYLNAHIHFMGIGGIGMSGIAKILKLHGYTISGCDTNLSQKSVQELIALGCTVHQGNNTPACQEHNIDVLVYSSAIADTNPEILAAQARAIPTIPRALMLAEIMRTKFSIAVTGAHGKTTVTSLIAHILIEAQKDPTVIIGGHLANIASNAHMGTGDFLVAEADESDRSFLRLYPTIAVVTNIDLEHLETYKDLEDIKQSFKEFITHVPFYGKAVVCLDDPHIRSLMPFHRVKTLTYSLSNEAASLYATDIELGRDYAQCTAHSSQGVLGTLRVAMPGKHNLLNALGALTATKDIGIPFDIAAQALSTFKGIDRRFTVKGAFQGATVIDDYGHHPTEIMHTLTIARKRAQRKLIVIFQPHRYSRTEQLWQEFVNLFAYSQIDELIITDIYPANEAPRAGISGKDLINAIALKQPSCHVRYLPAQDDYSAIKKELDTLVSPDDLVLVQGAGRINMLSKDLVQGLPE